ncbi:B12-binding domain-containing radical SAM protein [Candidatus Pelagibacter communis]|uniref:B12-binding domain-containing radical SAM protein n=1 Tax=Pelagibacter ubique TaxID=198252 RepID=UPI00094D048D|nr:radical SAM protein [Candidatus Pelagibacter ubique]|tara:strand:+ start:1017 stop:2336 length:1320 start_codon:yes stop_codon:yes gene_type:complete
MNILILDPEKKVSYRISKDTSGGYGTGNNFGDTIVPMFLKKTLKKVHDWPPMFAVYTMSALKKNGHKVDYQKNLPENFNQYDFFIVVSSIVCCETECEYIKELSKSKKKIFVIGPYATNMPQKYINAGGTVIMGEPEFFFLKDQDLNKLENGKSISFNHDYALDDLPYPDWNNVVKSNKTSLLFGTDKSLPILATRGCPYSCFKYCVYPLQQGRKPRQRDPKSIVDELEYWNLKFKVKMFIFRDPVFSINKKHTIEFCNFLINRKLNLKFVIETHLRILDTDLIDLLKKAGLKAVKVGVESFDEKVLKESGRFSVSKDQQLEKIRELEKKKIQVSAMYILGFPTDTDETINKTINYSKKLNTTYAQFSVWTPYPGTPVYSEFKDKINAEKYENFDQYQLVYNHNLFNKYEIRNYLSKAYTAYYLRINWLIKYIKSFITV